jgi:WD40 repeat protein/serine/threonine protein kinase
MGTADETQSEILPLSTDASAQPPVPQSIGPYRLIERLGEGGMGTVFKANQLHPVKRTVAIKLIKLGFDSAEVIARFESERQALARMDHPNIARVLDAGTDDRGRPYFVMEYVPGKPITKYADDNRLSIKQRLELMLQVCDAIGHAHAKAIIHRDIKASNVLAHSAPEGPRIKVIDFGVAKAITCDRLTDRTFNTSRGQPIGTYESMSPEQADGSPDIDTRTDVYALGVLLYELLSGAKPFERSTLIKAGDEEIRRIIREDDPPRPSTRLSSLGDAGVTIAKSRQAELVALTRQLKSELDWIPLMALRKERERRYATPQQMADDIQNYLDGRPLVAAPDSTSYRVRKFIRRNRGPIAAGALVLIVLLAGIAGTTLGLIGQARLRAEAVGQKEKAETATGRMTSALADAQRQRDLAERQRQIAEQQRVRAEQQGYFATIAAAATALDHNEIKPARELLDSTAPEFRRWEWGYLRAMSDGSILTLRGHGNRVSFLAFSADGTRLLTASDDSTARVWDTASGKQLAILRGQNGRILCAAFIPGTTQVITVTQGESARVWDWPSGTQLATSATGAAIVSAAISPNGKRVLMVTMDGQFYAASLWDPVSNRSTKFVWGSAPMQFAVFSPDGSRIISSLKDGTAILSDATSGAAIAVLAGHTDAVQTAEFSPDGTRIVTGSADAKALLWNAASGKTIALLRGHDAAVNSAAFSPDGTRVVTASDDRTARVWDAFTGKAETVLRGHSGPVTSAVFSRDGNRILTASQDKTARVWDRASAREIATLRGHEGLVTNAVFSPDGSRIATSSWDGTAKVWTAPGRGKNGVLGENAGFFTSAAFSPDGTRIRTLSFDGTVQTFDIISGRQLAMARPGTWAVHADCSPDGTRIATVSLTENVARIWDSASGRQVGQLQGHDGIVVSVAFSPDGRRIVTGSSDTTARIWDTASAKQLAVLRGHKTLVTYAAFSLDGSRVATASSDKIVIVWDAVSARKLAVLQGAAFAVFSPDGTLLVSGWDDNTARVWDWATGREVAVLRGHEDGVRQAVFSPDGTRVVTVSLDKTARLWDSATGKELAVLRGHEGMVLSAAFSPDGTRIVTASGDRTARVWDSISAAERYKESPPVTMPTVPTVPAPRYAN